MQRQFSHLLEIAPPGRISLVSVCAGQGRDVLPVLAKSERRGDVEARLVEIDPENATIAVRRAAALGLENVVVSQSDAAVLANYADAIPADIVVLCGVLGNASDGRLAELIGRLPQLCASDAKVIWTRHRLAPDQTQAVRAMFDDNGFDEIAYEETDTFGVGSHVLKRSPNAGKSDPPLFEFVDHGE